MGSRAVIVKTIQDVRASYWFLPSALVVCAAFLAQAMLWVDAHRDLLPFGVPQAFGDTQVDGARTVMSIISQSVFGVAGVMFSMTIVAVSFASGNFGPRLISNFMRDRGNQWALGILVATFVYCLLVTRGIQSGSGDIGVFVPHLSIIVAFIATFVSIFTVIFFVHHIPELINVSNITAHLGARLMDNVRDLIDDHTVGDAAIFDLPDTVPDHLIRLDEAGYIQTLNKTAIVKIAECRGLLVEVPFPPGQFVTPNAVVLRVWGHGATAEDFKNMQDAFALGRGRTEHQNLLFLIDQLVEMIARALSPGTNDPFTAVNCLNWLHAGLVVAATHEGGLSGGKHGRVMIDGLTFEDVLTASLAQPLPYIRDDVLTMEHLKSIVAKLQVELADTPHAVTVDAFAAKLN